MWKQKLGLSLGGGYNVPPAEAIAMIAQTGFDAISPAWSSREETREICACAREAGLFVESLHAPFNHTSLLWGPGEEGAPILTQLLSVLEDCSLCQIPTMVVHTWIGFTYTQTPSAQGLDNFSRLAERAKEYGVRIAFENTEGEEFLDALMAHFRGNDTVGFCWDSGHELCYNHSRPLLQDYGDRLLMTHLNDNLGIRQFDGTTTARDDLHLLPFDGIADWKRNCQLLQKSRKLEYLNFELARGSKKNRHENDACQQMPLPQYFAEAYKRACRVASLYLAEPSA